jgi:hypothetical protein
MRLRVIVPGEDSFASAGVRIRYRRIAAALAPLGHTLGVTAIDSAIPDAGDDTRAFLFSKCHDARAVALAARLRSEGREVGVDIFDDYYTQPDDSRFVHIRNWLREMAPLLTFALCSTPPLQRTVTERLPHLPCHMLNDPAAAEGAEQVAEAVALKLERVRRSRLLDIGWFGIGDNPHFPLGLADLVGFSGELVGLAATGLTPRLTILTNRRALTAGALEMLKRLPLDWRIAEWNETAESELVAASYACVLPVNAQPFSTVKSLNRVVTALTGGTQVLSLGYPLYDRFGAFIYRDARSLLDDIGNATPRLSAATVPDLAAALAQHASPAAEAARLADFLDALPPSPAVAEPPLAVLHGRQSSAAVHGFVQRLGHLSVTGPWTSLAHPGFDLRIGQGTARVPAALLSARGLKRLRPGLAEQARPCSPAGKDKDLFELPLDPHGAEAGLAAADPLLTLDAVFAAAYGRQIAALEHLVRRLFGPLKTVIAEQASPFWRQPSPAAVETAA